MITAYLAAEGFEVQCEHELRSGGAAMVGTAHGRLYISGAAPIAAAWVADTWFDAEELPISSIADAARQLRERGRNWSLYAPHHRGRAALIQARLPHFEPRPVDLHDYAPTAPLGAWTLLDPRRMLVTSRTASRFPLGVPRLLEYRDGPPSRAYLKLWEATLRLGRRPGPGDWCMDLGASPGGWTWLLRQWQAPVVAVDRAPLDEHVAADPGVAFVQASAFGLGPAAMMAVAEDRWGRTGPPTWVLGDIACFPERLEPLLERWQTQTPRPTMILTVKLRGTGNHEDVTRWATRAGARLCHLHHNKHELTLVIDR